MINFRVILNNVFGVRTPKLLGDFNVKLYGVTEGCGLKDKK
jgi:hypothetical protein